MKRLLLINPPQNHTLEGNLPKYVDEARGNIPPLGLLYTAAAVETGRCDWEVELADMSAGQQLDGAEPDLVGITATTFTLIDVLKVAKQVKDRWNVPVVLGGIHPTIYPLETAKLPNIECVFIGESEETFPQEIDAIASGQVKEVRGMTPDVLALPMPAYHLLDKKMYYSVIGNRGSLTSMFTSRGCPYNCIFCHRETMGKKFRARFSEQVVDEIKYVASLGIEEILFYDDTFTVDRQRAENICRGIIHEKDIQGLPKGLRFDIRARVDNVDDELLAHLREAGCKRIHYGVEASNDKILRVLRKGITIEQAKMAFQLTRKHGIEILAYFIIGSPTEKIEEILETIKLAKEMKPDYCHFGIMTPYPATPLYSLGLEEGRYKDYWAEFAREPRDDWQVPYWSELNKEELLELLDRAYREFYWRASYIIREAAKTKSLKQLSQKGNSAIRMLVGRSKSRNSL